MICAGARSKVWENKVLPPTLGTQLRWMCDGLSSQAQSPQLVTEVASLVSPQQHSAVRRCRVQSVSWHENDRQFGKFSIKPTPANKRLPPPRYCTGPALCTGPAHQHSIAQLLFYSFLPIARIFIAFELRASNAQSSDREILIRSWR